MSTILRFERGDLVVERRTGRIGNVLNIAPSGKPVVAFKGRIRATGALAAMTELKQPEGLILIREAMTGKESADA